MRGLGTAGWRSYVARKYMPNARRVGRSFAMQPVILTYILTERDSIPMRQAQE
jgi:hypothetical protein